MKDNLFEMLLNLFEKSLTQLRKSHTSINSDSLNEENEENTSYEDEHMLRIKAPGDFSTRVFTYDEQMKLTKASYQFLMRMKLWNILDHDLFETILNQLHSSDSRVITLQETKWTIRNVLAEQLNEKQLAFLDLVLYQVEDKHTLH